MSSFLRGSLLAIFLACFAPTSLASLADYDTVITDDAAGGLIPLARLTAGVTPDSKAGHGPVDVVAQPFDREITLQDQTGQAEAVGIH